MDNIAIDNKLTSYAREYMHKDVHIKYHSSFNIYTAVSAVQYCYIILA